MAGIQRRKLDEIYQKVEAVYNKNDENVVIKGKKVNEEEQDEDIDENDKIVYRLIRVEEELQDIKIN